MPPRGQAVSQAYIVMNLICSTYNQRDRTPWCCSAGCSAQKAAVSHQPSAVRPRHSAPQRDDTGSAAAAIGAAATTRGSAAAITGSSAAVGPASSVSVQLQQAAAALGPLSMPSCDTAADHTATRPDIILCQQCTVSALQWVPHLFHQHLQLSPKHTSYQTSQTFQSKGP